MIERSDRVADRTGQLVDTGLESALRGRSPVEGTGIRNLRGERGQLGAHVVNGRLCGPQCRLVQTITSSNEKR